MPRVFVKSLHGLRGFLALWVVLHHVSPGVPGMGYGYVAVDGFFILSGFVLMRVHATEMTLLTMRDISRFLRLRWWRTYPLYAVCVLLTIPFLFMTQVPSVAKVVVAVLLLEGWALPGLGINAPVWSLGVEWCGYIAFPLLAWCMGGLGRRGAAAAIATVMAAEVVLIVWVLDAKLSDISGFAAVTRMFGGFIAGCLLSKMDDRSISEVSGLRSDVAFAATCLVTALVLRTMPAVFAVPALVLIIRYAIKPGPVVASLLENRLALFLGRISFALYLSHFLVLKLVAIAQPSVITFVGSPFVGRALCTAVVLSASLGVATMLNALVEEPLRRYGQRKVVNRTKASELQVN